MLRCISLRVAISYVRLEVPLTCEGAGALATLRASEGGIVGFVLMVSEVTGASAKTCME